MASKPDCKNCLYFQKIQGAGSQIGECRRYAPRPSPDVLQGAPGMWRHWPTVDDSDWCGEWAALGVTTTERTPEAARPF